MKENLYPISQRRKTALHDAIGRLNSHDGHALSSSMQNDRLFVCAFWPLERKLNAHGLAIVLSHDKLSAEVKSFAINAASPSTAAAVISRTVSVDFQTAPAVYRRLASALEEVYRETKQLESKR